MDRRFLPGLSLTVMMAIGAVGVFVVDFAYGFEADPSGLPPTALVAALQDRQRWAVEEADDLSKILIVLKPFYVMLSAEQKETADRLFTSGPSPQCQPFFRHEVR